MEFLGGGISNGIFRRCNKSNKDKQKQNHYSLIKKEALKKEGMVNTVIKNSTFPLNFTG